MKTAVFPGSFDPFTLGHKDIADRALKIFDELIIAVGENTSKTCMLNINDRLLTIKDLYKNSTNVKVISYNDLTVNICSEHNANFIIRGLRNTLDFEYEKTISRNNRILNPNIETVFIISSAEVSHINSTIIREILKNNGDVSQMLPPNINKFLSKKNIPNP